jgi:hydroxyacylglutathione hydrolase
MKFALSGRFACIRPISLYHVVFPDFDRFMIHSIHPIPAFSDNYIWAVADSDSNRVCVVDPGDPKAVINYLQENTLELSDILITHHHPDHTGGIRELSASYSPRIVGPRQSNIAGLTEIVDEGDEVTVFGHRFSVIEVPGHTLDHIAFFSDEDKTQLPILFCGDTLFAAGCGRLFEGTAQDMHKSLTRLSALDSSSRVFCTHEYTLANLSFAVAAEPNNQLLQQRVLDEQLKRDADTPTLPSTINLELQTNPFLRCREQEIISTAAKLLDRKAENEVEVFSALRSWKDNF